MAHAANAPQSDQSLWKAWKENGRIEAKKALIEKYLPLVDYVVKRLVPGLPRNVSKDDLASHGYMGLLDAVDKFEPSRGLQFETYASWRIRGAIIDGLRQGDWAPRSVREKARKIEEAYQVLEQKYLRTVTDAEISEYLSVSESEFRQMLMEISAASVFSLEDPIKEEESETRVSLLVDEKAKNPDSTVGEQFLKQCLAAAIDNLTEKERTVISLYYYEDLSLSEIAEVMSLTPSRISQLHSKAISKLRAELSKHRQLLFQDS